MKNSMKHPAVRLSWAAVAVAIMMLAGCQKPYEKHYDLSVDSNSYTLPYTGKTFPLYVYCSGAWTAEFDGEVSWIRILEGTESGKGNGIVRISYKDNDEALRSVNLVIRSGEYVQTVSIAQNYNSTHLEVK